MNNLDYLYATDKEQIAIMISGRCEECKMIDDCKSYEDGIFCSMKWLLSDSKKDIFVYKIEPISWGEFKNNHIAVYCPTKKAKLSFLKAAKIAGIAIVLGIDYQKYDYYFVSYNNCLDCCYKEYIDTYGLKVVEYSNESILQ